MKKSNLNSAQKNAVRDINLVLHDLPRAEAAEVVNTAGDIPNKADNPFDFPYELTFRELYIYALANGLADDTICFMTSNGDSKKTLKIRSIDEDTIRIL